MKPAMNQTNNILSRSHSGGLTLIEVLIALVIIAVSFTALLKSMATQVEVQTKIQNKLAAHWIAMRAIHQIQIGQLNPPLSQPSTQSVQWLNQRYFCRLQSSPTPLKNVNRITVSISKTQFGPFHDSLDGFYYVLH